MSINHCTYGQQVAQRWLQTGWPNELQAIAEDARATDRTRRDAGDVALVAALVTISAALAAAQKAGVRFSAALPSADRLIYARSRSSEEYSRLGQTLIDTAANLRKTQPGLTFSWTQPGEQVRNEQAKSDPLEVRIVGMPPRETTTAVVRDNRDNLLSTTQVERDAA